jgi:hypothetical protein
MFYDNTCFHPLVWLLVFRQCCRNSIMLSTFKIHFAIFGFAHELQEEGCCWKEQCCSVVGLLLAVSSLSLCPCYWFAEKGTPSFSGCILCTFPSVGEISLCNKRPFSHKSRYLSHIFSHMLSLIAEFSKLYNLL